ncbi:hypothetical protein [Clostridium sp. C2-6-12]|nr:hypothetical protein [Clostridium sp. C2-6-12]
MNDIYKYKNEFSEAHIDNANIEDKIHLTLVGEELLL